MVSLINDRSIPYWLFRPSARERVLRNPTRYHTLQFVISLLSSTRFIWPFSVLDAIDSGTEHAERYFQEEFLIRAENLRSHTLVKDFLDRYPEFRGEIPQFEPSLTLHCLEDQERLEKLFWMMVRQKRAKLTRWVRSWATSMPEIILASLA